MATIKTYNKEKIDEMYKECKEILVVTSFPTEDIKTDAIYLKEEKAYRYYGDKWIEIGSSAIINCETLPTADIKTDCFYRLTADSAGKKKGIYYAIKEADNTYTWVMLGDGAEIIEVSTLPTTDVKLHSLYYLNSDTETNRKGIYYAVTSAGGTYSWTRLEESAYTYKADASITIDGVDYPTVTATVGDSYVVHKAFTEGKRVVIEYNGKYYDVINCVKSGDDYWCEYIAEHYLIKSGNHGSDTFKEYYDITQGISGNIINLTDKTGTLTDEQFAVLTKHGDKTIINSTAGGLGNKYYTCSLKATGLYYFARTVCWQDGKVYTETYVVNTDTKEYNYLSYAVGQTPLITLGDQAASGILTDAQRDTLLINNEQTVVKLGTYYYHVFRMWTSAGSHQYNFRSLSTSANGIPSVYVLNINAEEKTWTWREDEMGGEGLTVLNLAMKSSKLADGGTLTTEQVNILKAKFPNVCVTTNSVQNGLFTPFIFGSTGRYMSFSCCSSNGIVSINMTITCDLTNKTWDYVQSYIDPTRIDNLETTVSSHTTSINTLNNTKFATYQGYNIKGSVTNFTGTRFIGNAGTPKSGFTISNITTKNFLVVLAREGNVWVSYGGSWQNMTVLLGGSGTIPAPTYDSNASTLTFASGSYYNLAVSAWIING